VRSSYPLSPRRGDRPARAAPRPASGADALRAGVVRSAGTRPRGSNGVAAEPCSAPPARVVASSSPRHATLTSRARSGDHVPHCGASQTRPPQAGALCETDRCAWPRGEGSSSRGFPGCATAALARRHRAGAREGRAAERRSMRRDRCGALREPRCAARTARSSALRTAARSKVPQPRHECQVRAPRPRVPGRREAFRARSVHRRGAAPEQVAVEGTENAGGDKPPALRSGQRERRSATAPRRPGPPRATRSCS